MGDIIKTLFLRSLHLNWYNEMGTQETLVQNSSSEYT